MEVHSNHFVVLTDMDTNHARAVAYRFEQMRYVFGAVMQKSAVNLPVPLRIHRIPQPRGVAAIRAAVPGDQ